MDSLKYDFPFIKEEILNEIRVYHTLNSFTQDEIKENKDVEFESRIGKFEAQLKKKGFESLTYDFSTIQDPHFRGFNLSPRNYFITKINIMSKFDGNYPLT